MKNVQISQELFVALLHYHLSGENEYEEIIEQGLEQKLDAMLRHELYAQYKTAPTQEGGVGQGSGEVRRNLVRRRKPPAGRKGIF